jgi:hypothetical protein
MFDFRWFFLLHVSIKLSFSILLDFPQTSMINLLIFLWFLMLFVRWVSLMKYSILMNNWWVFLCFSFLWKLHQWTTWKEGNGFIGNLIVWQSISYHFSDACFLEYSKIDWGATADMVNFSVCVSAQEWHTQTGLWVSKILKKM